MGSATRTLRALADDERDIIGDIREGRLVRRWDSGGLSDEALGALGAGELLALEFQFVINRVTKPDFDGPNEDIAMYVLHIGEDAAIGHERCFAFGARELGSFPSRHLRLVFGVIDSPTGPVDVVQWPFLIAWEGELLECEFVAADDYPQVERLAITYLLSSFEDKLAALGIR
ncbi:hypothetical protein MNBD_PLANCTO03-1817 [hydrothermal vent metagenome]|uniref:Uncharacterized protein n=1 Tax=hydrothermal vent metagenome TaxID=652676 RepID=A0A3B1DME7_9ZZZZ